MLTHSHEVYEVRQHIIRAPETTLLLSAVQPLKHGRDLSGSKDGSLVSVVTKTRRRSGGHLGFPALLMDSEVMSFSPAETGTRREEKRGKEKKEKINK